MAPIKVNMLGRFEIVANGTEVVKILGSSRKRIVLLEYLLLNRDKSILMKDLFEVLWPGENSTNPESALKTLVSRLRATLASYSPDFADCIITERGGYRWNPALDCEIDIFTFEEACNAVLRSSKLTPEVRVHAARLMALYVDELLPNSDMESWVVSRSVYLHNIYLKAVQHYVELLKTENAHAEIAQVCRTALDVDAFDAALNLELMTALLKVGRSNEALAQYNRATSLHYNQLGIQPPEGMLEFYKKLIKIDNASKTDIDSIRMELCADDTRAGAFVCEYVIFKDIYQLHMRNLSRLGSTMFIALITISSMGDKPVEPLMLDKLMRLLLNALQTSLRRGDTISRYNSMQYAVLLPSVSYETGRIPLERVKRAFYKMYSNPQFVVSYRLAPIAEDK